jgi:hypothetical protein
MDKPSAGARIGDYAGERRGRGGFRAAEINQIFLRAGAAGEISRHGAQADAPGSRRLAHADAAVAARLVDARAAADQLPEEAERYKIFQHLAGSRINIERDAAVDFPAIDNHCRHREIAQSGIRRRADVGLINLSPRNFAHQHDVVGT